MTRRPLLLAGALIASLLTLDEIAGAQNAELDALPPPKAPAGSKFGRRSSVIVGLDNVFGYTSEGLTSASGRTRDQDDKGFFPGLYGPRFGFDGVFENGLTLGTGVQFWRAHLKGSSDDFMFISLAPRIGYAAPLGPLGVWIRGGPSIITQSDDDRTDLYVNARLEAFLIVTPVPHFGLLLGPSFDFGIATSRSKGTNDGSWHAKSVLVGLFGEL